MTTTPLLSIIIPVFNTIEYLDECIESLPLNTLKNLQLIFVDNKSTDGCYERLIEYSKKDKRIEVFRIEGGKQARCRNFGVQKAIGRYIGFCDSDDWCAPDMFEQLLDKAHEFNADITIGQVIKSSSDTHTQSCHFSKKYFKNGVYNTAEKPFLTRMTTCYNKIYKRSLLIENDIKFKESACPHEDVTFAFKAIFLAKCIACAPKAKYFWRTNNNSTTQKAQRQTKPNHAVFEMILELRAECENLNVPHEWVLAADRLIEAHILLMIKNISEDNISSYLRNALNSSGSLPISVFDKLGNKLNKEIIGDDIYEYCLAQKHFAKNPSQKLKKYRKLSIQLGVILVTVIVLNLLTLTVLVI